MQKTFQISEELALKINAYLGTKPAFETMQMILDLGKELTPQIKAQEVAPQVQPPEAATDNSPKEEVSEEEKKPE